MTFVVSAALLVRMRPRPRGETAPGGSLLSELRAGWAEFGARPWVWATVAIFSFMLLTALAPFFVLGPTVAVDVYGDRAVYGTMAAALGAGTIAGALIGFRWRPRRPLLVGYAAIVPWPSAIGLFAAGVPRGLLAATFVAAGTGLALFGVWWDTALAERIPPHALSRVSSYDWMGSLALLPLGYLAAGPLGEALGSADVLAAGGAIALVVCLVGFAVPDIRRLRAADAEH